jgi:hypothetical protein
VEALADEAVAAVRQAQEALPPQAR